MTPLFKKIYRESTKRKGRQVFHGLRHRMDKYEGHVLAFDVTGLADDEVVNGALSDLVTLGRERAELMTEKIQLPSGGIWLEKTINYEYGTQRLKDYDINSALPVYQMAYFVENDRENDSYHINIIGRSGYSDLSELSERADCCESDIDGHVREIIAYIYLINTPNIVKHTMSSSKTKRPRGAPSSAWMCNPHTVVKLCVDGKVIDVNASNTGTGERPWHQVRGHFHRYWTKAGLISKWTERYFRGNKEIGTVTREYECYTNRVNKNEK